MREVGIILIAAFAIDRIVRGLFFLLSYNPDLRGILNPESMRDPEQRAAAARLYRLVYAICAGYIGIVLVAGHMGIRLTKIAALDLDQSVGPVTGNLLDVVITGLLLSGGADGLAEALKLYSGKESKSPEGAERPIEITGKVVIEQAAAASAGAGGSRTAASS